MAIIFKSHDKDINQAFALIYTLYGAPVSIKILYLRSHDNNINVHNVC